MDSTWSSNNTSAATVNGTGSVSCVAVGTADIKAEWLTTVAYDPTCLAIVAGIALLGRIFVKDCDVSITSFGSPQDFKISTAPAMPTINAGATVNPSSRSISWSAQIKYRSQGTACSGGPDFDSSVVNGSGSSFSPNFNGFFGGDLTVTASCTDDSENRTAQVLGTDPGKASIQAEIGNLNEPFDAGDLKRIACWESGQVQFLSNGFPLLGGGGDVGIFQICFQRAAAHFWNWRDNVSRGREILNSSLSFAQTVPQRVRTEVVRERGPFPNATNFTNAQLRFEAIHAYNAGTSINDDGYWEWDDVNRVWVASPQGGAPGYVANVISQNPSCGL